MKFNIGDKIVELKSKRQGKVLDLVEERDTETGLITYAAVKVSFNENTETEWLTTDKVAIMLLENK
jgi:hypothetical protein